MVQQYGRRSGAPSRGSFFTQLRPYMVRKPREYQDQDQCATARMNRVAIEVRR